MNDTIDPDQQEEFKPSKVGNHNPAEWIGEDELLFNAIQCTSSACDGEGETHAEVDEAFCGEQDYEDEDEHKRSTRRALATTVPNWLPSL